MVAFALPLFMFATDSAHLGFYSDDAGFILGVRRLGPDQLLQAILSYVPGRNLHILWQSLIFAVAGDTPQQLAALHLTQAVLDAGTVVLFYLAARSLTLPISWALAASAVFALYPNHGETHFWLTAAPQNIVSTAFVVLYLGFSAFLFRTSLTRRRPPPLVLSAIDLLILYAALYTYDQTFFALALIFALRTIGLVLARATTASYLVGTSLVYLASFGLYALLKVSPSSGPVLSQVNLGHIWLQVRVSLSVTFGPLFQRTLASLIPQATPADRLGALLVATCFSGVVLAALLAQSLRRSGGRVHWLPRTDPSVGLSRTTRYTLLAVLSVMLFVAAYLPNYLWFIDPRHNFLPTVGVALVIGSGGAALSALAWKVAGPWAAMPVGFGAIGAIGVALFAFGLAIRAEQQDWVSAYQLRLGLYDRLVRTGASAGKRFIVFEGFPARLGLAPFFVQENHQAFNLLYPEEPELVGRSHGAQRTALGYFVNAEMDRYGGVAVRHVPAYAVLYLAYRGRDANGLLWSVGEDAPPRERLYSVSRRQGAPTDPAARGGTAVSGDAQQQMGIGGRTELTIRSAALSLRAGEVPGLLLTSCAGMERVPAHLIEPSGERVLLPILLVDEAGLGPAGADGTADYSISLTASAFPNICLASLYAFSDQSPRLIREFDVAPIP